MKGKWLKQAIAMVAAFINGIAIDVPLWYNQRDSRHRLDGGIAMDYEIIENKEILHEAFAGLLADFDRVLDKYGIYNDLTHPLCILEKKITLLWSEILTDKYSTMEDITKLKGQYEFMNSYVKGLDWEVFWIYNKRVYGCKNKGDRQANNTFR